MGRTLETTFTVPATEFDVTVTDLRNLGRVVSISEGGEDAAVKLAGLNRHLAAAQANAARLEDLRRKSVGHLSDALALEKEIAQANQSVLETQRQREQIQSTVACASLQVRLTEDYRAQLDSDMRGMALQVRNSMVQGLAAILSSVASVLGFLFEFGLPLAFWIALLAWPARILWRRFRRNPSPAPANAVS